MIFHNIFRHSLEFPEAWVATFKTVPPFASLMWLVVGNSVGKERVSTLFLAIMEPRDLLDKFPQSIV